eukprot:2082535-Alexandrium_andersonii.AAC.1
MGDRRAGAIAGGEPTHVQVATPSHARCGVDNNRPVARRTGRQAQVGLVPPAQRAPIGRPPG